MSVAAVKLRPATRADLPTLLAFEQGIVAAERPFDPTLRPGEIHYYDLAALLETPELAHIVVAESNGRIVGSGSARLKRSEPYVVHERHAYLGFMYVVPEARGLGVNALILEELTRWAAAKGIDELVLEVYLENHRAVRAYRKAGFTPRLLEMRRPVR
jgi:GNAT superfamily N-acetyltransferase